MGFLFRGVLWGLLLPVPESGVITLISGNAMLSAQPSLTFCLHLLLLALRHQVSVLLMSLSTAVGPESQVEQIAAPSPYTLCLLPGDIVHRVPSQATSFQSEEISSFRPVYLLPLGWQGGKTVLWLFFVLAAKIHKNYVFSSSSPSSCSCFLLFWR